MGITTMAVLGVCSLLVTLSLNMLAGWTLDICTAEWATDAFCDGIYWTTVVKWLPTWLYIGQIMVVLSLASPFALVRMGR